MFIVVKHGDECSLFNPDCSLVQLVTDIRKRCECLSPEVGVAVATDKFAIIHLSPEESLENCSSLFVNRATYTLLAVHYKEVEHPQYEALSDNIDYDLAVKLEMLSNPNSVHRQNKWNRAGRKSTKTMIQLTQAVTSISKTNKKTGSKNRITI